MCPWSHHRSATQTPAPHTYGIKVRPALLQMLIEYFKVMFEHIIVPPHSLLLWKIRCMSGGWKMTLSNPDSKGACWVRAATPPSVIARIQQTGEIWDKQHKSKSKWQLQCCVWGWVCVPPAASQPE